MNILSFAILTAIAILSTSARADDVENCYRLIMSTDSDPSKVCISFEPATLKAFRADVFLVSGELKESFDLKSETMDVGLGRRGGSVTYEEISGRGEGFSLSADQYFSQLNLAHLTLKNLRKGTYQITVDDYKASHPAPPQSRGCANHCH